MSRAVWDIPQYSVTEFTGRAHSPPIVPSLAQFLALSLLAVTLPKPPNQLWTQRLPSAIGSVSSGLFWPIIILQSSRQLPSQYLGCLSRSCNSPGRRHLATPPHGWGSPGMEGWRKVSVLPKLTQLTRRGRWWDLCGHTTYVCTRVPMCVLCVSICLCMFLDNRSRQSTQPALRTHQEDFPKAGSLALFGFLVLSLGIGPPPPDPCVLETGFGWAPREGSR